MRVLGFITLLLVDIHERSGSRLIGQKIKIGESFPLLLGVTTKMVAMQHHTTHHMQVYWMLKHPLRKVARMGQACHGKTKGSTTIQRQKSL